MWLTADRVVHTVALPIQGNASLARLVTKMLSSPEQRRSGLDDWLFEFEENLYDQEIAPFPYSEKSEAAFREIALPIAIVEALAAAMPASCNWLMGPDGSVNAAPCGSLAEPG